MRCEMILLKVNKQNNCIRKHPESENIHQDAILNFVESDISRQNHFCLTAKFSEDNLRPRPSYIYKWTIFSTAVLTLDFDRDL